MDRTYSTFLVTLFMFNKKVLGQFNQFLYVLFHCNVPVDFCEWLLPLKCV